MKWVEFSSSPPPFEICNTSDGMCVIRFYCDVQASEKNGTEDENMPAYRAICYELTTRCSANLQSRIENNYDAWLEKAKRIDGGLHSIKDKKIKESKEMLAEYLASHPLVSTAHNNAPGTYSVTEEKQT